MIKKYFRNIIFFLFLIALAEISEARSIGYFLFCASNSSMSAEIFNSRNSYVLDNARWKILGSPVGPTNFPSGYITPDNVYGDGTYYINFLRIKDFYPSPVEVRVVANNGLVYTNWYHVYSNSLYVVVTGLNAGASAAWQLTSFPVNEFTNTICYSARESGSYTGNVSLTAIPTGTYSIAFEQKKGYYAMPATNIAITGAPYDWYSTNYFVAYSNSLAVVASGVTSGSNVVWTLTAANSEYTNTEAGYGYQFTNSYTLSLIPTGTYTITWPEMPGYITPAATITNITESSPLINTVTGLYVPVIWGNNTNEPWTNPPSGTVPTNFPVQTNDIAQMVDTNGNWETPSKSKIIAANGLATTSDISGSINQILTVSTRVDQAECNITTNAENLADHIAAANPHGITPGLIGAASTAELAVAQSNINIVSNQAAAHATNNANPHAVTAAQAGAVPTNDILYGTIGLSMTNYVHVPSSTNWFYYDPVARLAYGCATNENTGPQGPQGETGPQGPAGTNGMNGAPGPQGPAGTNGADGATGPQGLAGTNGADGLAATISIAWASNGVPGSAVVVTNVGSSNAAQFAFIIPAGSNGLDGAQGPQGETGPQGPAGTNGATGPQGQQGEQGPQGAAGTNGANGAQGPQGPAGPVTNRIMDVNGVLYTITNAPAAGQVIKFDPVTSNAWFADASESNAYQAFTGTLAPDAGGTCTVTYGHGSLVKIQNPATNAITLTIPTNGYPDTGVLRIGVEILFTGSVAFATATITNSTTPAISTSSWNSLFFRRTVNESKWKGRQ